MSELLENILIDTAIRRTIEGKKEETLWIFEKLGEMAIPPTNIVDFYEQGCIIPATKD